VTLSTGAADAASSDWMTVTKLAGARLQACKVATTKDGPWKVKLRVNARKATRSVRGSAQVLKGSRTVGSPWQTAWISPGEVSRVGSVRMPRGSAYALDVELESDGSATGAAAPASGIRHC
jgi:hypothetical protein